jgi:hypothetical protein
MATRTISAAGGNWNSTGTWDEGAVPGNGDDVIVRADGTSGNVTVTANAAARTINLTAGAYNGTFTLNSFTLQVWGSLTLNSSGTCPGPVGVGVLSMFVTGTITSNGKTIACQLYMTTAPATFTLADDLLVTGYFVASSPSNVISIVSSSKTMTCSGGISVIQNRHFNVNNTTLKITGGTLSGTALATAGITGVGTGSVEFAGAVTMDATGLYLRTIPVKFTSGYSISGGSFSMGGNVTTTGTMSLTNTNFKYIATGTLTLGDDISCGGDFNILGCTLTTTGAKTITLSGTFGVTNANSIFVPGNCTLNITAPVSISTAAGLGIQGSDVTLGGGITILGTGLLAVSATKTLTVNTKFDMLGDYLSAPTVYSLTAGTKFNLTLHAAATVRSMYGIYTDTTATGQTIYNAFGGAVTNSTGITNKTNEQMLSSDPGVGNVLTGTVYSLEGASLVGTFTGKSSWGSI